MRELTIDEMTLVTGAANENGGSNTKESLTSTTLKTAIIEYGVEKGMEMAEAQVDLYVKAYEKDGWSGVAAATPAAQLLAFTTGMVAQLRLQFDGNDYCEDGGDY